MFWRIYTYHITSRIIFQISKSITVNKYFITKLNKFEALLYMLLWIIVYMYIVTYLGPNHVKVNGIKNLWSQIAKRILSNIFYNWPMTIHSSQSCKSASKDWDMKNIHNVFCNLVANFLMQWSSTWFIPWYIF